MELEGHFRDILYEKGAAWSQFRTVTSTTLYTLS